MNKIEILGCIGSGLRKYKGVKYGDISGLETVMGVPSEPEPHLLLLAPDPMGNIRRFRVTVTEIEPVDAL